MYYLFYYINKYLFYGKLLKTKYLYKQADNTKY